MRDYTIKHAIVFALSLVLGGTDTFAVAHLPTPAAFPSPRVVTTLTGRLGPGDVATHTIRFERGRTYRVVGAPGEGTALALRLFSPRDRELDRDHGRAGHADVAIVPAGTGRYRVDVTMTRCASDACAYALVVERR